MTQLRCIKRLNLSTLTEPLVELRRLGIQCPALNFPGSVKLVRSRHITTLVSWAVARLRQNSASQFSTRHTSGGALPSLQLGQCGRFPLGRLPTSAKRGGEEGRRWSPCGHPSRGRGEEGGQGWMQAEQKQNCIFSPGAIQRADKRLGSQSLSILSPEPSQPDESTLLAPPYTPSSCKGWVPNFWDAMERGQEERTWEPRGARVPQYPDRQ